MSQPDSAGRERPKDRYRRILATGNNTERTVFFSDAVMAIAMTLLVLEIRIPDVSQSHLASALLGDVGAVIAYVIAFALISANWISHHRKFKVIERYDGRLQIINLVFLIFIAMVPLPVRVMAQYGPVPISVMLYAFIIAMPSLLQLALWSYAWHMKLFRPVVDIGMYRSVRRNLVPVPIVFLLSIAVCAIFGPYVAMYSWFVMIPVSIIVKRWTPRAERPPTARRASRSRG